MNNKLGGGQQSFGGVLGRLVIELDPKYAFLILTVVDNADIFDVDIVKSQGGGHLGQHAGPVVYVDAEGEHPLYRAAGGVDKGVTVYSGAVKEPVQRLSLTVIQFLFDPGQGVDIAAQQF